MRTRFIECAACGRHVREGDEACPFCGAAAPVPPPPVRALGARVSRAAMLAAGAAGGVIVMADCGNATVQAFYGVACTGDCGIAAPEDAGKDADGSAEGAAVDSGADGSD